MTDQYQASNDPEHNDVTGSNFHHQSNVSNMEAAGALFDQSDATHTASKGVYKATAQPDDGLVEISGIQLPRDVAEKLGVIAPEAVNDIHYTSETPNEEVAEEAADDVLGDLPLLDSEQTSLLDQAVAYDGGSVVAAVSDILADGDLSEETLDSLMRASGADADVVNTTIESISTNLDSKIEQLSGVTDASEMLRLASESQPNLVKSAVMASINGDVSSALDLAKSTYANLDTTSYGAELEYSLNEAGYKTTTEGGRMYIQGNEFSDPTIWSTASSAFSLSFTD